MFDRREQLSHWSEDTMEELRFPRNGREGLLYGGIIALITCLIMMTFNIVKETGGIEQGLPTQIVTGLPLVWIAVMLLMTFFVGKVANIIMERVMQPSDSANTRIVLNIVICVSFMSVIMTAIGPLVGSIAGGMVNLMGFENWLSNWPVNFCVAFWVEMIIAQPAARAVMKRIHIRGMKAAREVAANE